MVEKPGTTYKLTSWQDGINCMNDEPLLGELELDRIRE